jgi:hypothetical protein
MTETLYVFASGYRKGYQNRALDAVCRPIGSAQTFEYTVGKSVAAATLEQLSKQSRGSPAFLVFVDRRNPGAYRFRAMRRARFVSAHYDATKVRITLELLEWPFPATGHDFSAWVAGNLTDGPKLTDNDPEKEYDGNYALFANAPPDEMHTTGDGWRPLCDWLATTNALRTDATQTTIFARLDILHQSKSKTTEWTGVQASNWFQSPSKPDPMLVLGRNVRYRAHVTYYFPTQRTNKNAEVPYEIKLSPGIQALSGTLGNVGAESRSDTFELKLEAMSQRSQESIGLTFGPAPSDLPNLTAPRLELTIQPKISSSLWLWLTIIGICWVGGSGLMAEGGPSLLAFAAPFLQYVAVIAMFKVFGSKLT